ncbi:hypothetical protein [Amycolatopsis albispora]|uniref:Uncharacterized protein n=1 Tax=Amycolatopsis albispora TaxID=1804986 RepID=A0A344LE05_9PSEU|nr:hypothetical protein [Amycolatopsis albispora]AXB46279.1 hypothetical protein A4R43_30630 [Amycolatopsis albispora]
MTAATRARTPFRLLLAGFCTVVQVLLLGLTAYLIVRVVTYGVFWDADADQSGTWGGPTLLGAWLVHALIGLPGAAVSAWLANRLGRAAARLRLPPT